MREIYQHITEVVKPTRSTFRDIETGTRFGRLTVLGFAGMNRYAQWWCECDCSTRYFKVCGYSLFSGHTVSCGCVSRENLNKRTLHGECRPATPEYRAYQAAAQRCSPNTTNASARRNYVDRGIEFRFTSFEEFLKELGRKPTPQHTLDRIDNDGHYEPGNVRWATLLEQRRNQRKNIFIEFQGQSLMLVDWAQIVPFTEGCLYGRLYELGWCVSCSLTLPLYGHCTHISTANIRRPRKLIEQIDRETLGVKSARDWVGVLPF